MARQGWRGKHHWWGGAAFPTDTAPVQRAALRAINRSKPDQDGGADLTWLENTTEISWEPPWITRAACWKFTVEFY
jgi:hypothetical protein